MRDDVLGVFGQGEVNLTGKPVGGDIREGKPTPLLAMAYERASTSQRQVLDQVGAPEINDATILQVQQVIQETGALVALETKITGAVLESVNAIKNSSLNKQSIDQLIELAEFVAQRNN